MGQSSSTYFYSPVDPKQISRERAKAKELRQTQWWKQLLAQGLCYYCHKKFSGGEMTMDHILPLGRGGRSTKGNIVTACKSCNTAKAHKTPAEQLLESLKKT